MPKSKRVPVTFKAIQRSILSKKSSKKLVAVNITLEEFKSLLNFKDRPIHIYVDQALESLVESEFEEINNRLDWMVKRMDKIMDCIVRQQHHFGCKHWTPPAPEEIMGDVLPGHIPNYNNI